MLLERGLRSKQVRQLLLGGVLLHLLVDTHSRQLQLLLPRLLLLDRSR